jgi:hypothetical protein
LEGINYEFRSISAEAKSFCRKTREKKLLKRQIVQIVVREKFSKRNQSRVASSARKKDTLFKIALR